MRLVLRRGTVTAASPADKPEQQAGRWTAARRVADVDLVGACEVGDDVVVNEAGRAAEPRQRRIRHRPRQPHPWPWRERRRWGARDEAQLHAAAARCAARGRRGRRTSPSASSRCTASSRRCAGQSGRRGRARVWATCRRQGARFPAGTRASCASCVSAGCCTCTSRPVRATAPSRRSRRSAGIARAAQDADVVG